MSVFDAECVVESIEESVNQEISQEDEAIDPSCGLHMSCTSSFANFGSYTDQTDQGILSETDIYCQQTIIGIGWWGHFVLVL